MITKCTAGNIRNTHLIVGLFVILLT